MQTISVDKKKTPEIADWAADKEPGDRLCLYGTIKANDDQTLTITVEEVGDDDSDDEGEDSMMGNQGSGAAPVDSPPGSMGAMDDTDTAV